jgi:hypothetical protein
MLANFMWAGMLLLQGQSGEFGWDVTSMWHNMGWPGRTVVLFVFIVSIYSMGTVIDRALTFGAARWRSRAK